MAVWLRIARATCGDCTAAEPPAEACLLAAESKQHDAKRVDCSRGWAGALRANLQHPKDAPSH